MDEKTKELGINLTGVIKSIVRDVIHEQAGYLEEMKKDMSGLKWSNEEEQELKDNYSIAITIIAKVHKRGKGGVHSRLLKLIKEGEIFFAKD